MKNILLVLLCCVARMTCAQEVAFYDDRQVGSPIVNAFCQDADNFMWMGTGKGKRYGLPLTGVEDIVEDSGGRVFVVSPQAVYLWDAQADGLVSLPYAGKRRGVRFCSASLSADGHVMLGTFGQGVLWVKRGAAEITDTDVFDNVFMDASRAKVNTLFEDNHRNLWAGCQYQGVLARLFRGASFSFWKSPSVTPAQINAIYCDSRNSVWCSMEETGIYQLGAGGKLLRHIPASGTVFSMYEDSRGTFWAGVEGRGALYA